MKKNGLLTAIIVLAGWALLVAQTIQKITVDDDIQLIHLQDSVFVHLTWHQTEPYGRFPSNGLLIIRQGQALMIDTPLDNDKTIRLTRYLKDSLSVELAKLIVGHFHDDCLGGLAYLQGVGIESIANSLTIDKCKELGLPVPSTFFTDSMVIDFNGEQIDCRFFGAGHSFDNITVWIPGKRILFGGCLVKSIDSIGLGNLSDAMVADWDTTIKKIMDAYEDIQWVIPGHGDVGGVELLTHTMRLVEKEKSK